MVSTSTSWGTSGAQSVQEQLAATRPLDDHVFARLGDALDGDRISNHERPRPLARVVRLGDAAVLVVRDVRPEGPARRSCLGYLERHPHQLLVHWYSDYPLRAGYAIELWSRPALPTPLDAIAFRVQPLLRPEIAR